MIQLMALSLTAEYKQHPLTVFPRPQKKPDNHKIAPKASRFLSFSQIFEFPQNCNSTDMTIQFFMFCLISQRGLNSPLWISPLCGQSLFIIELFLQLHFGFFGL